jgi:hypothetical protein
MIVQQWISAALFYIFRRLKKRKFIVIAAFVALCWQCTKVNSPAPEIYGKEYFPAVSGRFAVYDADSTVYTEIPRDTVNYRFRLKVRIADSFTDAEGRQAFRVERFVKTYDPNRHYDSLPWRVKDVWMLNAGERSIEISEGNIRYTKLIFPVKELASWNGNAANTKGEQQYTYEYTDRSETIGGTAFEKVLKVKQEDLRTLISTETSHEKYAAHAGLVEREVLRLYSNTIVPGKPVEKRIENGYIYKQTLHSHGYE